MAAIVEFLDAQEAMHAATVLKAFGLKVDGPHGRETDSGPGEAPLMVWTVCAPELLDTPSPEPHEDDYGESHFDREQEDRDYWSGRGRQLD